MSVKHGPSVTATARAACMSVIMPVRFAGATVNTTYTVDRTPEPAARPLTNRPATMR